MKIHPSAVIEPGAELGRDVEIGPFCYVAARVTIGDGTVLGPHVTILPYTTLGKGCRLHANAVIGDLPQDLAFKESETFVRIGNQCVLREGVTIHRGTKPGTATELGDQCYLMANSHLAHNVKLGNQVILVNGVLLAGYVEVGDRAFLGGAAIVHQFVRIGRLAMLGGGCGIGKDVPPFCTTVPFENNAILGLNVVGMRRAGLTPGQRLEIKRCYHLLYRSGLNLLAAQEKIKAEFTSPQALEICAFLAASRRGICLLGRTRWIKRKDDEAEDA
ncbi:MAG: acyl-ACP--UDP-N-acetylglucosamine O-acyltransferase [Lentisphaerae bacterium]|nr:acyl-ACP--UDP-N-acetylglucosamine O-acyltransferase [Lentisphaerota bacterium]